MFYLYQLLSVPVLVGLAWSFWTALHLHPLNSIDLDSTLMDHVPLNWGILQISPPFRSKGRCKGLGASGSSRAALLARSWVGWGSKSWKIPRAYRLDPFSCRPNYHVTMFIHFCSLELTSFRKHERKAFLIWTRLLEQIFRATEVLPALLTGVSASRSAPSLTINLSMGNSLPARGEVTASRGSHSTRVQIGISETNNGT